MKLWRNTNNNNANALLMVLGIMVVLSTIGVTFSRYSVLNRKAAGNFTHNVITRMTAQSGVEYAVAKLRQHFCHNPGLFLNQVDASVLASNRKWLFWTKDITGEGTPPEDDIGAGSRLEHLDDSVNSHPSFYAEDAQTGEPIAPSAKINGRKVSFARDLGNSKQCYTLKIIDTTSQINLNMHIDPYQPELLYPPGITDDRGSPLAAMLNNLSTAISSLPWYGDRSHIALYNPGRDLDQGPLRGLGAQIIRKRRELGGFTSKWQLSGITDGTNTITDKDVADIWDFVSVFPGVDEFTRLDAQTPPNGLYRMVRTKSGTEEREYYRDYRCPVNINTAAWPVLVAVFQGVGRNTLVITAREARMLATEVCKFRRGDVGGGSYSNPPGPFASLDEWDTFLDESAILPVSKATMLKAMADPNPMLNRLNPDRPLFRAVGNVSLQKIDLEFYTCELCLFPYGVFEIMSLGEIFSLDERLLSYNRIYALVRAFELKQLTTQIDFDSTQSQNFTERQLDNAFPSGNNIQQRSITLAASDYFGFQQPLVTGSFGEALVQTLGSFELYSNLIFRADFDGYLTADAAVGWGEPVAPTSKFPLNSYFDNYGIVPDALALIYNPTDLASDGVVFNINENEKLCYQTEDNLPLDTATVAFWAKFGNIDKQVLFFADNVYPVSNSSYQYGIQTQIAVELSGNRAQNKVITNRSFYIADLGISDTTLANWQQQISNIETRITLYDLNGDGIDDRHQDTNENGVLDAYESLVQSLNEYLAANYAELNAIKAHIPQQADVIRIHSEQFYGMHLHEWYQFAIRWQNYIYGDYPSHFYLHGNAYNEVCIFSSGLMPQREPGLVEKTLRSVIESITIPIHVTDIDEVKNVLADLRTLQSTLRPLTTQVMGTNTMYLGMGPAETEQQLALTIDDFRIAKTSDWENVHVTRYPWQDRVSGTIARFENEIEEIPEVNVGACFLNIRQWKTKFAYNENPFFKEDDTPVLVMNNGQQQFYDIPISIWSRMWGQAWDLTIMPSVVRMRTILVTRNPRTEQPNWQWLLTWYWNRYRNFNNNNPLHLPIKNLDAVEGDDASGSAPLAYEFAFDTSVSPWKYTLRFYGLAGLGAPMPIFQAPLLDDFVFSYYGKAEFLYYHANFAW